MMKQKLFFSALLIATLACAGYFFFFQTYHFAVVQEGVLYRDGVQNIRVFRNTYSRHPFKSVINLQSDGDLASKYGAQEAAEKAFCEAHGIAYFRIPMKEETPPDAAQVARLLELVGNPKNQPVFMHDSQGVIREGMMVAVWQMEEMDYTPQQALDAMLGFGHPHLSVVSNFITHYQPLRAGNTSCFTKRE